MEKPNIKLIIVLAVLAAIYLFTHVMIVPGVIETEDELYEMTTKAITHHKTYIRFKSEVEPEYLDYEYILDDALDADMYDACEFYEYKYSYKITSDGLYDVKLTIKKPSAFRSAISKHRIKAIARRFENLSDYEKVKAAHDYIIWMNTYWRVDGGAYKTIVAGHSACNGYALAFYALMTELGVPVTCETDNNHMWNTVMVDGLWYNIDLTWDDAGTAGVRYDYFLKCNADWEDHTFGTSNADQSLPVTGKSAKEYRKMVPNYKIARVIYIILTVVLVVYIIYLIMIVIPKKKAKQKELQQKLLEKSMRDSRELMKLDEELNDHEC